MQLNKIQDTRHPIEKLSRKELEFLVRKEGRDIDPDMPANLVRRHFIENPPSVMPRPMRPQLGSQARLVVPPYEQWVRSAFGADPADPVETEVVEASANDDLRAQWEREKSAATDWAALPFWQLKKECKRRGIKMTRTDGKAVLVAKLSNQANC